MDYSCLKEAISLSVPDKRAKADKEAKEKEREFPKEGYHAFVFFSVRYPLMDETGNLISSVPGVINCYAVSGDKDILAICHAKSKDRLKKILKVLDFMGRTDGVSVVDVLSNLDD